MALQDLDTLVDRRRESGQRRPVVLEGEADEFAPGVVQERVQVPHVHLRRPRQAPRRNGFYKVKLVILPTSKARFREMVLARL